MPKIKKVLEETVVKRVGVRLLSQLKSDEEAFKNAEEGVLECMLADLFSGSKKFLDVKSHSVPVLEPALPDTCMSGLTKPILRHLVPLLSVHLVKLLGNQQGFKKR